jgi:putative flippase GtrA
VSLVAKQASRYLIGAVIALIFDFCAVWVLLRIGVHPLIARGLALLVGITTTYFFSRRFAFSPDKPASWRDWSRYVAAQSVGSALNYAAGSALLWLGDGSTLQVAGAIACGAALGFSYNFFAARRLLHGKRP